MGSSLKVYVNTIIQSESNGDLETIFGYQLTIGDLETVLLRSKCVKLQKNKNGSYEIHLRIISFSMDTMTSIRYKLSTLKDITKVKSLNTYYTEDFL